MKTDFAAIARPQCDTLEDYDSSEPDWALPSLPGSKLNISWIRTLPAISPPSTFCMQCESCARIPYDYLTIDPSAPGGESRVTDTTTEHHPRVVVDPQIRDHATDAGFTDDESSDDEFFECFQPGEGPAIMEPVPSSANQSPGPPAPANLDPGEITGSESQPISVETVPQARGMYRLLNLVTERGVGGISESNA